ncbi:hypothetical protein Mapa_010931 [Marchantia paleacea]|nr:hypothetical protein Mapa_010931 [Marchantia paleacea]
MISIANPVSATPPTTCRRLQVTQPPPRSPNAQSASLGLTPRFRSKLCQLVSPSLSRRCVKLRHKCQLKLADINNGQFVAVHAISISGDLPHGDGEGEGTSKRTEPEPRVAKATLEMNEEREVQVDGEVDREVLVEYRLEESGHLSKVKLSVGGDGRSETFRENITGRLKPHLQSLLQTVRKFSLRQYIKDYGKKKPGPEDINFNAAVYNSKEGVDSVIQWTSTELTLQHAQMARIAKDTRYLVLAFGLFGIVRILEAIVLTFTSRDPRKLLDASNALDPLTVAFLANGMRKPMVAMLNVDPTDLQEVNRLKMKFWKELHAFYERQWKVMATLGIARLLNLIATHLPAAQFFTGKLKLVWDMMITLPLF